jgi:hypothetical protein
MTTKKMLMVKFSQGWRQWIICREIANKWLRLGCLLFPDENSARSTAECLANLYPELYELETENGS